ncbi:GntR family transcriptional regulator [Brucella intermedia]|uniref:GntR family transcriptional regulator n=1 Tax=Brucella intermedia TaxID=94625 RepID=UPI00124E34CB|nr:GntR family transcriptional regulator [Brucella intermedia]KAB2721498.1 GntR family transcriptional regulator [Brucella intermedia]
MPQRYLTETLQTFPDIAHHTAPLIGVEAQMYNRLWRSIIDGKLKPGMKLREDVIGETFGISRTLVRKVLVIMEQEGIVDLPVNHGAYVATPTPEDAKYAVEAARLINVNAVVQLSQRDREIHHEHLARIRQHILLQEEAEQSGEFAPIRIISGEFLVLLVHIHGNRILANQYENLITRLTLAAALYQRGERKLRAGADFQRHLLDRILAKDTTAAAEIISNFYESVELSFKFEPRNNEVDLRTILMDDGSVPARLSRKGPRPAKRIAQN